MVAGTESCEAYPRRIQCGYALVRRCVAGGQAVRSGFEATELELRGSGYKCIVPNSVDTNLSTKHCAYDRIVVTAGALGDHTDKWGIDRAFNDNKVSNRWLI